MSEIVYENTMNNNFSVRRKQSKRSKPPKNRQRPFSVDNVDINSGDQSKKLTLTCNNSTTQRNEKNLSVTGSSPMNNKLPTFLEKHSFKKKSYQNFSRDFQKKKSPMARIVGRPRLKNNEVKVGKYSITNFSVQKLEKKFYFLICCTACKKFYNAKREPRIYLDNVNVCTDCISKIFSLSTDYVKMNFPLNYSYLYALPIFLEKVGIFSSEPIFANELSRSLKNNCNQRYSGFIDLSTDLQQSMHHIEDLIDYVYKIVDAEHEAHSRSLLETMASLEKFKIGIARPHSSDELVDSFRKAIFRLQRHKILFGALDQTIDDIDGVTLYKHALKTCPREPLTKLAPKIYENVVLDGLELFTFIDVNNRRLYSKLSGYQGSIHCSSFHPKFPQMTLFRIANFFRFVKNSVKNDVSGYLEIPVSVTATKCSDSVSVPRIYIYFGKVNLSWHVASLFLANRRDSILGTEIEVTKEKIIFKCFPRPGNIIKKTQTLRMNKMPHPVTEGMAELEGDNKTYRLVIYRYDIPTKLTSLEVGILNKFHLLKLKEIPLGTHKIIGCGISIFMNDKKSPMFFS